MRSIDGGIRVYYCRNAKNGSGTPKALIKLGLREDVALEAVPCSGRVDPRYILKAFESGVSAVCIMTCPNGDCKLMEGNLRAVGRTNSVRKLLSEAGLDPDTVQIFLPEGSDSQSFEEAAENVAQFVDEMNPAHEVAALWA